MRFSVGWTTFVPGVGYPWAGCVAETRSARGQASARCVRETKPFRPTSNSRPLSPKDMPHKTKIVPTRPTKHRWTRTTIAIQSAFLFSIC